MSEETHENLVITKFPGGGLQQGEGTIECITREFEEELGVQIDVREHHYTTDFYQPSVFDPKIQVLCIYYIVEPAPTEELSTLGIASTSFDHLDGEHKLYWKKCSELKVDDLTFPTDKAALTLLLDQFKV
jgi:8-oxo-dGTP pyrophosphatase MutT (NUDIX family)